MNIKPTTKLFTIITFLTVIIACNSSKTTNVKTSSFWDNSEQKSILDFEEPTISAAITTQEANLELVESGVTNGQQALKVTFKGDREKSGFEYVPKIPIDASQFKDFSLIFDATNLTAAYSAQIFMTVTSTDGGHVRRSAVLPVGTTKNFFFELFGEYVNKDTGLRDDPVAWDTDAVRMKVMGLKTKIDYSKIEKFEIYLEHSIVDKTVIFDNIRLVENPPISTDYLVGIIDKYGQAEKINFEGKITSDAELKALAEKELEQLEVEGTMKDRTKFGGWANGPKLKATGYFRTKKIGNKWAMVDPEGYLFFSTGIANVRMANTTSFTGIDFKDESVRYRDPEDVTPEDSRGMVALSEAVTKTAYVAYPDRNKMFLDLPAYDNPLANNYSYRREQHIGPFEHGETYSHYQANLERRYGEPTPDFHRQKWVDVTLDRFLNWGFTSFGNWAATEFYDAKRMPYFANGWIIGDFKTVKSGMDYWGPMPDVFDPEFERRANVTLKVVAEEVQNSPWCVGVFIDNEKSWGVPGSVKTQYGIPLYALSMNAKASPIKAKLVSLLKTKYKDIATLNKAWETEITDWATLEKGINYLEKGDFSKEMVADFSNLLEIYAEQYFRITHDALEKVLPNHLYMGCRFATWGMSEEVRNAATKYVDVFSYNYYHEALSEDYWKFLEAIDKPSLIGEFHIGTDAAGLFHPGLVHAADHKDRAKMYKKYMHTVIDNPFFVGAHWFQYLDSPTSGRAHDGENYNVGFVRITDVPYPSMVKAAKELNTELYTRRYGDIEKQQ